MIQWWSSRFPVLDFLIHSCLPRGQVDSTTRKRKKKSYSLFCFYLTFMLLNVWCCNAQCSSWSLLPAALHTGLIGMHKLYVEALINLSKIKSSANLSHNYKSPAMNKSRENDYASQSRVIPFNMLFVEGIPNPIAKTLSKIMQTRCTWSRLFLFVCINGFN